MRSKTDWLDAGLAELAANGSPGLRIDVLCASMQATKGSFYHHFADVASYRRELADHFEQRGTTRYLDDAAAVADEGPRAQLDALRQAVSEHGLSADELDLERAVRAWATHEPFVAEVVARTDERRITAVTELLGRAGVDRPGDRAAVVYLVVIGGLYVEPPLTGDRISALIDHVLDGVV